MPYKFNVFIMLPIGIAFIISSIDANAQTSLLQQAVNKMESYKNFSYQSVYKQKEHTGDTSVIYRKDVFSRVPDDKPYGYLFNLESLIKGNSSSLIEFYNGQNVIDLFLSDSTYAIAKTKPYVLSSSVPGQLNFLKDLAEKRSLKIMQAADTVINNLNSSHLILNTYDTIINKQHYYTRIHIFIDKLSGMPNGITTISKSNSYGSAVSNFYSEMRFFDYKFNRDDVNIASMTIPEGFRLPGERPALLAPGTTAPDWTLYTADGKKTTLAQLKGKVVMLDFFFIGCHGCMLSLQPLNSLHEKYKNKNFEIVSMTHRDSKKSVIEFKKTYGIKYPLYINAADVVNKYNVNGFPTFYFIDKNGKIANVFVGYDKDFEEKVSSVVDDLLAK